MPLLKRSIFYPPSSIFVLRPVIDSRSALQRLWEDGVRPYASSLVFLPICVYFAFTAGTYTFMDTADLIIHEAGHFFFRVFGWGIGIAGGTLMQIFLPSLLVWNFLVNNYRLGAQIMLFWLGHNLINISVYAADARSRVLPLLGGDNVLHDWHTMLSRLDLLAYDGLIAGLFYTLGLVAFLGVLVLPRLMPE